jgi:hypothetical protein
MAEPLNLRMNVEAVRMAKDEKGRIERLITVRLAAELLGYAPDSLRDPRVQERLGLRPVRLGGRSIRFTERDLRRAMQPESA